MTLGPAAETRTFLHELLTFSRGQLVEATCTSGLTTSSCAPRLGFDSGIPGLLEQGKQFLVAGYLFFYFILLLHIVKAVGGEHSGPVGRESRSSSGTGRTLV